MRTDNYPRIKGTVVSPFCKGVNKVKDELTCVRPRMLVAILVELQRFAVSKVCVVRAWRRRRSPTRPIRLTRSHAAKRSREKMSSMVIIERTLVWDITTPKISELYRFPQP